MTIINQTIKKTYFFKSVYSTSTKLQLKSPNDNLKVDKTDPAKGLISEYSPSSLMFITWKISEKLINRIIKNIRKFVRSKITFVNIVTIVENLF